VDVNVSEKHTVFSFRAEVTMLGSGGIYTGLEEGRDEGVDQSWTKNEGGGEISEPIGNGVKSLVVPL
jgi:hypothetical protein